MYVIDKLAWFVVINRLMQQGSYGLSVSVVGIINISDEWSDLLLSVAGIKKYIVGLIIKTSSDSETLEKEKVYLGKLNMILVQVNITITVHYLHLSFFVNTVEKITYLCSFFQ